MENTRPRHDDDTVYPTVRRIETTAPLEWLKAAARDLKQAPGPALFYGAVFALMGWLLSYFLADAPHVVLGLITGFTLVGPFLATGLYDIARRLERHQQVSLTPTLTAWRGNGLGVGFYAIILALLMAGWVRVSVVLVALFFVGTMPTLETLLAQLVLTVENLPFLVVYFGVGFFFAAFVFALSAISIPMMLDRDGDTLTSMIVSVNAIVKNPKAMALWAGLIVALTGLGMATFYVGLVVTMPLVGMATWHGYRELVE